MSRAKVLLGKALFFEEQLSSTRTVACATCHDPLTGGGDSRFDPAQPDRHPGFDGELGTEDDRVGSRSLPLVDEDGHYRFHGLFGLDVQVTKQQANALSGAAYADDLFWNGRAGEVLLDPLTDRVVLPEGAALESQALAPILSSKEMSQAGRTWPDVIQRLEQVTPLELATDLGALGEWIARRDYPLLFEEAFGTPEIDPVRIAMALASYERSLAPTSTPVDDLLAGATHDLSSRELRGSVLFRDIERTGCVSCHSLPLHSDNRFHYTGVRAVEQDLGRFLVTSDPDDLGAMRTPSLRNVEYTAPYFMDGRFSTLEEVVAFYDRGGDYDAPSKDPRIRPLGLSDGEKADLVAYLRRPVSDVRMVAGEAPFDRPTLYGGSDREPQLFGLATAGTGGFTPSMLALEPPLASGELLTLGVGHGLGGAPALLLLSSLADARGASFQGARFHVARGADFQWFPRRLEGDGAGQGWSSVRIEPPVGVGLRLHAQWLVFDPQGGGQRFAASQAVELTGL